MNPWEGCTKVSPGCAHCYAEARNHRFGADNWGKGKPRRRTSAANWRLPLKWNAQAWKERENDTGPFRARRPRVFCASLADWLDDEVPIEWLADLLWLIRRTENLDWLMLSKRPENFVLRLSAAYDHLSALKPDEAEGWTAQALALTCHMIDSWLDRDQANRSFYNGPKDVGHIPPANVWIGTSVEDQQRADERIQALLKIPATVRFLSVEPMLSPIDFGVGEGTGAASLGLHGIDWAIFGGESGANARPCSVEWIRDGIAQCRAAGVAPFVKQIGRCPCRDMSHDIPAADLGPLNKTIQEAGGDAVDIAAWEHHRHNVPFQLKDKKGGDMSEWPEDLRVREFPTVETAS